MLLPQGHTAHWTSIDPRVRCTFPFTIQGRDYGRSSPPRLVLPPPPPHFLSDLMSHPTNLLCLRAQSSQLLDAVAKLINKCSLDSNTLDLVLNLVAHVTRHSHALALQLLDTCFLSTLFSLPASVSYSGLTTALATIMRNIIDDPYSVQTNMESHMRKSLSKTITEAQKGNLQDGVVFVPVMQDQAAEESKPMQEDKDAAAPAGEGDAAAEGSGGDADAKKEDDAPKEGREPEAAKEAGKDKAKEESRVPEGKQAVVQLDAFLKEIEGVRRKGDGSLFLNAFMNVCVLFSRKKPGSPHCEYFVAPRAAPCKAQYVKVSKPGRKNGKPVDEIMGLLLRNFMQQYHEWRGAKEDAPGTRVGLPGMRHGCRACDRPMHCHSRLSEVVAGALAGGTVSISFATLFQPLVTAPRPPSRHHRKRRGRMALVPVAHCRFAGRYDVVLRGRGGGCPNTPITVGSPARACTPSVLVLPC